MKTTTALRRTFWATAAFMELSALASFFLTDRWMAMSELSNGKGIALGIDLFVVAALSAYAAVRRNTTRTLTLSIIVLQVFYALYLVTRIFSANTLSVGGFELITICFVDTIVLIVFLLRGLHQLGHAEKDSGCCGVKLDLYGQCKRENCTPHSKRMRPITKRRCYIYRKIRLRYIFIPQT